MARVFLAPEKEEDLEAPKVVAARTLARVERPRAETSTEEPSEPLVAAEILAPSVVLAISCSSTAVRCALASGVSSGAAFALPAVTTGFAATTTGCVVFAPLAAFFSTSLAFFAAFSLAFLFSCFASAGWAAEQEGQGEGGEE